MGHEPTQIMVLTHAQEGAWSRKSPKNLAHDRATTWAFFRRPGEALPDPFGQHQDEHEERQCGEQRENVGHSAR